MQILSRFSVWIKDVVSAKCEALPYKERMDFLINVFIDTEHLLKNFPKLTQLVHSVINHVSPQIEEYIQKSLEDSRCRIVDELNGIDKCIVDSVLDETQSAIRQVNDLPRLFRRTNRDNPTQPCLYVSAILLHATNFKDNYGIYASRWFPSILSAITCEYYDQASDVLTSVRKTEESLRRFKKIRDPSGSEIKGNSDDDKIRMQLEIDIQHYIRMVGELSELGNVTKLQDLLTIINLLKSK